MCSIKYYFCCVIRLTGAQRRTCTVNTKAYSTLLASILPFFTLAMVTLCLLDGLWKRTEKYNAFNLFKVLCHMFVWIFVFWDDGSPFPLLEQADSPVFILQDPDAYTKSEAANISEKEKNKIPEYSIYSLNLYLYSFKMCCLFNTNNVFIFIKSEAMKCFYVSHHCW